MKRKVQSQSESKEKKASDINKNDPKEINTSDIHKNECSTPQNMKSRIYNYIGSITHAQSFLQDNKFIKNGYRINFHSPKQIFKSLFMLHNELVNIWTHLIGALIVICLVIYIAVYLKPSIPQIKNEIQNDLNIIFSPIYEEIKKIEESLNNSTMETLHQLKHGFEEYNKDIGVKYQEFNENLARKFVFLGEEIELIKNNFNSENAAYIYEQIQSILHKYSSHLMEDVSTIISIPFSNDTEVLQNVRNYTYSLMSGLDNVKSNIIETIDSESYDWIDIYKSFLRPNKIKKSTHVSRWPIFVFLISAILCQFFSATFHLFSAMSKNVCDKMLCLDYAGISLLISGSTFPPLVYSFFCQPIYYIVYSSVIGTACLVVFIVSLFDTIHKPEYRKIKGILYGSLGIFAGFPMFHMLFLELYKDPISDPFTFVPVIPYFLAMGFCYLSGLAIYTYQCPERFKPGKFDIWGSSHQLWHLMIVIAIFLTYFGSLETFYLRQNCPCGNQ